MPRIPAGAKPEKPKKPYRDFPLFPHATKRWAKKIRGKMHYFGPWHDPQAAVDKYNREREDLHAGRTPRGTTDGLTVADLVNGFLTAKRHLVDTRELSPRTFTGYKATGVRLAAAFGRNRFVSDLRPDDFDRFRADLAKTRGPVGLAGEIRHTRIMLKWAHDTGLVDAPVRVGPQFKEPARRVMRQARQAAGKRMFEADELRKIIAAATGQMKAMVLLGVNCGFGQSDCAALPRSAVKLQTGWIDYPRPKTAVERRVPLWPETVDALAAVADIRPDAKSIDDSEMVFLTRCGVRWVRSQLKRGSTTDWVNSDSVAPEFSKLLKEIGLKRTGLNFYALRHTFETIAGESRDQVAVDAVMGHDPGDMASRYRERVSDDRLRDVTEQVRTWLFPPDA